MIIAVLCEQRGTCGYQLIGKAREMGAHVVALAEDRPGDAIWYGADSAVFIGVNEDDCAQGNVIAEALRKISPDAVLFPATVRGRFLSSWVAARLDTGLTADCTALDWTDGLLRMSRPAYGGNLTADIVCEKARPQMASVRPGVFPLPEADRTRTGDVQTFQSLDVRRYLTPVTCTPAERTADLQTASVIVAGGKGIGSKKGFDKLFTLAGLLSGAVGATRSAVDAGYISYAHQVGQTGVTTRPKLYIAFGISGMIQHVVGMNSARCVVAVNKNKNAPIFRCADYGIVDDWEQVADQMIEHFKGQQKEEKV